MKRLSKRAPRVNAIIHHDRTYHGVHEERRPMDPAERMMRHGRIRPMQEPGFIARLFGAR